MCTFSGLTPLPFAFDTFVLGVEPQAAAEETSAPQFRSRRSLWARTKFFTLGHDKFVEPRNPGINRRGLSTSQLAKPAGRRSPDLSAPSINRRPFC
jgi:hypothetical protein